MEKHDYSFVSQLDPCWCSWFAGFLAGEGYFQLTKANKKNSHV
jgi:hypothetical protein